MLSKSGVPPVGIDGSQDLGDANGAFLSRSWNIAINKQKLDPRQRTFPDSVARTLFHEMRHAEQWWAMAQLGHSFRRPGFVGIAAGNARLAPNSSGAAVLGQATHDSVYGPQREYREGAYDKKDNGRTRAERDIGFAQYQKLAEEEDAFARGAEIEPHPNDEDHPDNYCR
jgi:hypothetical protein